MNCPYNVGDNVRYDKRLWLVVEKNSLGNDWILTLQNNSGERIQKDCSQVKGTKPLTRKAEKKTEDSKKRSKRQRRKPVKRTGRS
jgi:hypothetical protein